jgi:hypothetical protein
LSIGNTSKQQGIWGELDQYKNTTQQKSPEQLQPGFLELT